MCVRDSRVMFEPRALLKLNTHRQPIRSVHLPQPSIKGCALKVSWLSQSHTFTLMLSHTHPSPPALQMRDDGSRLPNCFNKWRYSGRGPHDSQTEGYHPDPPGHTHTRALLIITTQRCKYNRHRLCRHNRARHIYSVYYYCKSVISIFIKPVYVCV